LFLRVSAGVLGGLLAGCSGSILPESKKIEYKSAGKLPPLEIPPDLTQQSRDERYTVPDVAASKGSATYSAYSVERGGDRRVPARRRKCCPRLTRCASSDQDATLAGRWRQSRAFVARGQGVLAGTGIPGECGASRCRHHGNGLGREPRQAAAGHHPRHHRQGFRQRLFDCPNATSSGTRLEKGAEPGTVEIYISHRGMYEIYTNEGRSETRWQPSPADPELEAEMLRRLMVRLGVDEARAKTMVAADQRTDRAKLARSSDGAGAVLLEEAFDRAWRRVGLALDRVGFTVEDRDRTQGLYFVRYVDPEIDNKKKDEKGFSKACLLAWLDSGKPSQAQYRIHLKAEGEATRVEVLSREGGVDRSETSKRILGLLHEQLK
jgi:outer membrane protein assembly factor BamC